MKFFCPWCNSWVSYQQETNALILHWMIWHMPVSAKCFCGHQIYETGKGIDNWAFEVKAGTEHFTAHGGITSHLIATFDHLADRDLEAACRLIRRR